MLTQSYDRPAAGNLVPLLQSIANEIRDRRIAIKKLDLALLSSTPESDQALNLQADRANHRKEMRLAMKEITRLGCSVAREHPLRVLIPGRSGEFDGFVWDAGETTVQAMTADSAA